MAVAAFEITRRRLALAVFVVAFAAFLPTVRFAFLAWDDDHLVYMNPALQAISQNGLSALLGSLDFSLKFFPLTQFVYAFLWWLQPGQPGLFHLASLLVHAVNSALFFSLITALLKHKSRGALYLAALVALLWALHPLRVEVVAWISALGHALALLFMLLSASRYLREGASGSALFCYLLACLAYPTALAFPLVLFLWEIYQCGSKKVSWKRLLPFFAVAAFVFAAGLWVSISREVPVSNLSVGQRIAALPYFCIVYVGGTFFPHGLAPLYSTLWNLPSRYPMLASCWILFFGIAGSIFYFRKKKSVRTGGFLSAAFLVFTLPFALERVPFLVAHDRYSYVSTTFLFGLIFIVLEKIRAKWPHRVFFLAVPALGFVAVFSAAQAFVWINTENLLRQTLSRLDAPQLRFEIRERLAKNYVETAQVDKARREISILLLEQPQNLEMQVLAASAELAAGQTAQSIELLKHVLTQEKRPDAFFFLAVSYLQAKDLGRARQTLSELEKVSPRHAGISLLRQELGER